MATFVLENQIFVGLALVLAVGLLFAIQSMGVSMSEFDGDSDCDFDDWD